MTTVNDGLDKTYVPAPQHLGGAESNEVGGPVRDSLTAVGVSE